MLTPAHLIKVLNRLGYPVTERRLTDWRKKGLLPKLQEKGRQHHGKVYYWEEPDVVAQAITVHTLMARRSRSDWVLLSTWFAGFEMPIDQVRRLLQEQAEEEKKPVLEELNTPFATQIQIARWGKALADQIADSSSWSTATLIFVLNLYWNFDYSIDKRAVENLATDLLGLASRLPQSTQATDVVNSSELYTLAKAFQDQGSFWARYDLITETTDENLFAAHRDWRMVVSVLRRVLRLTTPEAAPGFSAYIPLLVILGNIAINFDLILRKSGYGPRIEKVLLEVVDFMQRSAIDRVLRQVLEGEPVSERVDVQLQGLRRRVTEAWSPKRSSNEEETNGSSD